MRTNENKKLKTQDKTEYEILSSMNVDDKTRLSSVFYEAWYKAIKKLSNKEKVKAFEYILDYSFYGIEPDKTQLDKTSGLIFIMAKPSIDSAQNKYDKAVAKGKKGGRPKKITEKVIKEILKMRKNGMSQKDVASELSLSIKSIQRVEQDKRQNHNVNVNDNVNGNDNDNDNVSSNNVAKAHTTASPNNGADAPTTQTTTNIKSDNEYSYDDMILVLDEWKKNDPKGNKGKPYRISKKLGYSVEYVFKCIDKYTENGYKIPDKPKSFIKTKDGGYSHIEYNDLLLSDIEEETIYDDLVSAYEIFCEKENLDEETVRNIYKKEYNIDICLPQDGQSL